MNRRVPYVLAVYMVTLIGTPGAVLSAPQQAIRGFDLRRLEALHKPAAADEHAATYLAFLTEETRNPSPPREGLGGGTITHEYILTQIVKAGTMPRQMSHERLLAVAGSSRAGEFRDCIMLTLAGRGHKLLVPFLIGYMADAKNYYGIRGWAAGVLQRNPDPRAVPVLADMLSDPTWHVKRGIARTPEEGNVYNKGYDLRVAARLALRSFQRAGIELPLGVLERLANVVVNEPYDPARDGPAPKD